MNQPKNLSFTILLIAALAFFSTHAAIVSAQDKKEESGGDVFETIDPFKQKREDPFQDPLKDPKKVEDPFEDPPTESEKKESKPTESKSAETKQDKPAGPPEKVEDPKSIDPFGDPPKQDPEKKADPFGDAKLDPDPKKVDPFGDLPKQDPEKTADPFGDAKQDPEKKADPFGDAKQDPVDATGQAAAAEKDPTEKQDTGSEFDDQFWRYLSANNYKNWAPVPGKSGDFYPGESPHGVQLKMYLNRTAAGNPASLPNGSVIIKENYGADNSLKAITVMYRSKGYNPAAGDWYWIKYNPDGTTAKTPEGMNISGAFQSCIACHSNAKGDDHTFFNDGE